MLEWCLPFGLFAKGGRWAMWLELKFWKWKMLLKWWLDLECHCFKESQSSFPNIYAHRWETAHIWEAECPSCFHETIHVCRLKHDGKFQSTCQPKHQGLGSEDHKAQLHLLPRACFFTAASTTLSTSIAHWQPQKGAMKIWRWRTISIPNWAE